jgi:SEC-C motif domain protein
MLPTARCPCHSGRRYKRCCQPYHQGVAPPDPASLMRSRYAAYAIGLVDYVVATTDPDGPQWNGETDRWREEIRQFGLRTSFLGLQLLSQDAGPDQGTVHFQAELRVGDRDASFAELSLFTRDTGRWKYHSGTPQTLRDR